MKTTAKQTTLLTGWREMIARYGKAGYREIYARYNHVDYLVGRAVRDPDGKWCFIPRHEIGGLLFRDTLRGVLRHAGNLETIALYASREAVRYS